MDDGESVPSLPLSQDTAADMLPMLFLAPDPPGESATDTETITEIQFFPLSNFVGKEIDFRETRVKDETRTALKFHAYIRYSKEGSDGEGASDRIRSSLVAVPVTQTKEGDHVHVAPPVHTLRPDDLGEVKDNDALELMRTGGLFDLWFTTSAKSGDDESDGNVDEYSGLKFSNPVIFVAHNVRVENGTVSKGSCPPYVNPYTRSIADVTTEMTPDEIMADIKQYLNVDTASGETAPAPSPSPSPSPSPASGNEEEEYESSSDSDTSHPEPDAERGESR